ncbi:MAG: hypothetical protein WCJ57_04160 [Candidatus Falkowbacteria bacterium]
MSRSSKKNGPVNGKTSEEFVPTGIVINVDGQRIFIKKAFISAFGYENGAKKKIPLSPDIFHQTVNGELVKKQKGQEKKREVYLIGPNSNRMGTNNANNFIDFMSEYGLSKSKSYEVVEVSKEAKKDPVSKKKLEMVEC